MSGFSTYPAGRVVELFHNPPPEDSHNFMAFGKRLVEELERVGKKRTAERYTTVLNSFTRFRGRDGDIPLEDIGSTLMLEYEAWLKDKGICPNSTSYYMRNLRAVYNRAVDRELTVQRSPFKHVYTGIDKTVKRAVSLKAVRMIRDLDLRLSPGMEYARDMFMLSFYTRGMSFVDIAYLKKADLKGGVLTYRRRKTGRRLSIKWEKPMQEILDRYGHNDSPYLFPVIRDTAKDAVRQYRSTAHFINGKLKELGKRLGLGMPLTMYVARHAWASIARSKNVPLATISEAMGHDSENTTKIYLASLDTSQVDKANDIILKSL
ncbi:tyrosine-type recombinase/integrase [Phocaeicola vulgatus]|uniref:tyrosine-type recombinase/integrase n=1 Tax=Phocaeicola vulgatus TaxID=821 RepID=UPI0021640C13|nr:site-specific integrase [Phocaeicola vulgatus]MCS2995916.1 site-specific integrase [Phocaeicola vulgatus]UVR04340.1 site-specific integrase [Phocaeicola vulgatus]